VEEDVKVLLIEDDVAAAEMYRLRLRADGYSVVIAHDGHEGLRMASDEAPDFIYLDLRLPGLDGFEVLERLRADAATMHIPVIILTNGRSARAHCPPPSRQSWPCRTWHRAGRTPRQPTPRRGISSSRP
jgi:CheY-like chemotaxis protein